MSVERKKNGRWRVRWRDADGKPKCKTYVFREDAERHQAKLKLGEPLTADEIPTAPRARKTFGDVVEEWKGRQWHGALEETSIAQYSGLLRLHFPSLLPLPISEITPPTIDKWIARLKTDVDKYGRGAIRVSFREELRLLRTILGDYGDHLDEPYLVPIKKRHWKAVKVQKPRIKKKDLQEDELDLMLEELVKHDFRGYGRVFRSMAIVQYYHSLRVSEAAALSWSNVQFDLERPEYSRLIISQHVLFRVKPSRIKGGFKNSNGDVREHPLMPRSFAALREMAALGAMEGLVFGKQDGSHFEYDEVRYAYDAAFKRASLPYTATHVMRHGGTRTALEETGGDRDVARQQLGNRNDKSVEVYAVRSAGALTRYARSKWENVREGVPRPTKLEIVK